MYPTVAIALTCAWKRIADPPLQCYVFIILYVFIYNIIYSIAESRFSRPPRAAEGQLLHILKMEAAECMIL